MLKWAQRQFAQVQAKDTPEAYDGFITFWESYLGTDSEMIRSARRRIDELFRNEVQKIELRFVDAQKGSTLLWERATAVGFKTAARDSHSRYEANLRKWIVDSLQSEGYVVRTGDCIQAGASRLGAVTAPYMQTLAEPPLRSAQGADAVMLVWLHRLLYTYECSSPGESGRSGQFPSPERCFNEEPREIDEISRAEGAICVFSVKSGRPLWKNFVVVSRASGSQLALMDRPATGTTSSYRWDYTESAGDFLSRFQRDLVRGFPHKTASGTPAPQPTVNVQ